MLPRRCVLLAAAALLLAGLARAECPNGCSGNGDCMAKDMCECYKDFQGNDCSDRTCLFAYAHVDTPRGDLDMDQDRESVGTAGWLLEKSQQAPAGTYEYFHPDAAADEAHFYLECANKGICDRASGLCTCFDGYEGNGCKRTTCPNKCNGHGTCHNIRQLGEKAAGTLFGVEHPAGTMSYDLWDSNSTYGCRCDPWYAGADCSRRTCKVGVDPLYLAVGTPTYETFIIHVFDTAATAADVTGSLRLRLFDYYGESYITEPIALVDDEADSTVEDPANSGSFFTHGVVGTNADAVAAAIKAVPNLTYRDVKCETAGSGSILAGFKSLRGGDSNNLDPYAGLSVVCQYIDNPGKMRVPEIVSVALTGTDSTVETTKALLVTTTNQGWDDEWFTKQTTAIVDDGTADSGVTWTTTVVGADIKTAIGIDADPVFVKLGSHIVLANPTGTDATHLVLIFALPHALSAADKIIFIAESGTGGLAVAAETQALTVDVNLGDTTLTFDTTQPDLKTGDLLFFENQFFTAQQVYQDTNWIVNLDKPFGGASAGGAAAAFAATTVYIVTPPDQTKVYNYVSPCSGRGLCSAETGVCTCFKGYTNDNCNTQNILAL